MIQSYLYSYRSCPYFRWSFTRGSTIEKFYCAQAGIWEISKCSNEYIYMSSFQRVGIEEYLLNHVYYAEFVGLRK